MHTITNRKSLSKLSSHSHSLIRMIHPEKYIQPVLRKRRVGLARSEWTDLSHHNSVQKDLSRPSEASNPSNFNSQLEIDKLINLHSTPQISKGSPVKDLSHSFQYPAADFKFEMKITKMSKDRNKGISGAMTQNY